MALSWASACSTTGPVGKSCVSRPKKQGAICLDENREAVCQAEDADGKCVNFVLPYAKTDGMLMFDPAEYKARIKRAQEQ